jgi:iron complex outermembrane receptor protein
MIRSPHCGTEMAKDTTPCRAARGRLLAASSLMVMTVPLGVSAQTAPATIASAAEPASPDIVVTGRFRNEQLNAIPEAVSVLTAAALEQNNVKTLKDVTLLLPNVGISESLNPASTFISVRGVNAVRNSDPAVAIVIDGVQITNSNQVSQGLVDIDQIEVLRGPQGALYGRNAIGGAIVISTRKPTNETEGKVELAIGNGQDYRADAVLSGALIKDKLLFRIAAGYHDFGGLIQNDFFHRPTDFATTYNAQGRLIFNASDDLIFDLKASYEHLRTGTFFYASAVDAQQRAILHQAQNFNLKVLNNPISVDYRSLVDVSLKVDYRLGATKWTNIFGVSHTLDRYGQPGEGVGSTLPGDTDFLPLAAFATSQTYDIRSFSYETRLKSDSAGPFQWLVGLYYLKVNRDDTLPVYVNSNFGLQYGNAATGQPLQQGFNPALPLTKVPGTDQARANTTYAGFANVDYKPVDQLTITAGIRYDIDKRRQTDNNTGQVRQTEFRAAQPKLQLSYQATPDELLYATVSRGFRGGGFNSPITSFTRIYNAETLWNYEAGIKNSLFARKLQLNAAVFYADTRNNQQFQFDGATGSQVIFNIPKSHFWGIEADANWRTPVKGLGFTLSGGYIKSRIDAFDAKAAGFPAATITQLGPVVGNQLPIIYHWSVSSSANYTTPITENVDFIGSVSLNIKGNQYFYIDNADKARTLHLVNAQLGVETSHWQFRVFAENLFNEAWYSAYESAIQTALPQDLAYPQARRKFGAAVRYKF